MTSNPRYANGHRRRTLRRNLLAAGAFCVWPDCPWPTEWLNAAVAERLHHHDDHYPEVDELVPVKYGGSVTDRANTRLLHRWCNNQRGAGRQPRRAEQAVPVSSSPGWGPSG